MGVVRTVPTLQLVGRMLSHVRLCTPAVGIPQIYHFGQEGLHNILVIDLLGPSLEDLVRSRASLVPLKDPISYSYIRSSTCVVESLALRQWL